MSKRRNHDAVFKVRVALEALKGKRTVPELATACGVYPMTICQRKKSLPEGAAVRGGCGVAPGTVQRSEVVAAQTGHRQCCPRHDGQACAAQDAGRTRDLAAPLDGGSLHAARSGRRTGKVRARDVA
jgi:transposase